MRSVIVLSRCQIKVQRAIEELFQEMDWSPSYHEIAARAGVSVVTVFQSLPALQKAELIVRKPGSRRGIQLLQSLPPRRSAA
jgi:DNA-binding GntR family transcriptional regulator